MTTRETFEDLYALLEIPSDAPIGAIKSAFHKKAHVWHPDRNSSVDATAMMQRLLAAYKILADSEARERYDREYRVWKASTTKKNAKTQGVRSEQRHQEAGKAPETHQYKDPELNKWVRAAKRQASEELSDFLEQLRSAGEAAGKGAITGLRWAGIYLLISLFLLVAIKGCKTEL